MNVYVGYLENRRLNRAKGQEGTSKLSSILRRYARRQASQIHDRQETARKLQ